MPSRPRNVRASLSGLPLMLAIALVMLGQGATVRGNAIASASFDAKAHARDCHCGHCRGQSCCCGRSAPERQTLASKATSPLPSSSNRGPCLGAAPCGEPGMPTTTPSGPDARGSALIAHTSRRPTTAATLLPPPDSARLLAERVSRIDRPPRA